MGTGSILGTQPEVTMAETGRKQRFSQWFHRRKLDLAIVAVLVAVTGVVSGFNMTGYPQRFEDEGTYVSQAWAVMDKGTLAHYTYWYDHPPLGWVQIAGYFWLTHALERYNSAITAGREFMLVLHLITIVLLYALARRLQINRIAAVSAILFYVFSPLGIIFSRYVFLDNVALPWLLGAFLLALSPRRNISVALGAAVCMAIAVLSKETLIVLLPVIMYILWRNGDARNRRYLMAAFLIIFTMISASYVLFALLKNEFFPGKGHVSLLGSLYWQLFSRAGSGSIFQAGSGSRGLVSFWLGLDPFLVVGGLLGLVPALSNPKYRPIGIALVISLAILLRKGYLPFPYVIAILPFAALTCAIGIDRLIHDLKDKTSPVIRSFGTAAIAELAILLAVMIWPAWYHRNTTAVTTDADASSRQTVNWVEQHVPKTSRMIVESALWSDLEDRGYSQPKPVWLYKTETDPAVTKELGGWHGIDYVILNGQTVYAPSFKHSFPTVATAVAHGQLTAQYGKDNTLILIYKIPRNTANVAAASL
jgi:hypothetical protein